MNYQSPAWQAALQRPRERKWELPYGADEPLMPWIAPPLPENLKKLFLSIGAEYEAQPGQLIYRVNNDLNSMTLITHGIAGRSFGNPYNQSKYAMAIAIPGRIAGGNHTFFSRRPGNGSYFAVSPVRCRKLRNDTLKALMKEDKDFHEQMCVHLECLIQSDRIGLAANMSLPVRDRIFLFFLTWSFAYGRLIEINGTEYVECDVCINQTEVAKVVAASIIQVRREIGLLKESNFYHKENDTIRFSSDALDPAWLWLCGNEEGGNLYQRNKDWRSYLT
ncbi:Crp/Fnr family transcriptional regulator [Turicimonas muris]|uniref:Crp/Fnr family transcriptional regulator n=1 Tax=Turicimonas muris TaxID=1796652 RepID=UPI0023EFE359|nr:hypothetical protein [Turicimonas muris]